MENEFDEEALNAGLNDPAPDLEEASEEVEEAVEQVDEIVDPDPAPIEEEDEKPLTRGQARIQALANEKAAEKTARELAEQRALQLERQLQELQRTPPEEENLTDLEKWQRHANEKIAHSERLVLDMNDRSDFLISIQKNPAEMAYLERVEAKLSEVRKSGFNPRREDVLIRLMGEDTRKKQNEAPAIKRAAAERVKAAVGKPLGSKSNVAPSKSESTLEERLRDITL